jgi:DNA-binding MarR family transcriptional regulator
VTAAAGAELDHTANLLGALVLSLHDRMSEAIEDASGQGESGAATLSVLADFLDRPTISRLRAVVGLTPSGGVRLVDRLEEERYLTREPGADARSRSIELTRAGRRAAEEVRRSRAEVMRHALSGLSEQERRRLDRLLARVLVQLIRGLGAERWMCRLCDTGACGRADGACPVANEAKRRFSSNHVERLADAADL